jgi:osmoprotectant transport system substrate-binding protein
MTLGLVGAGSAAAAARPAAKKTAVGTIVIGSTNFTEQYVAADLYAGVLEHAGFKVQVRPNLGTRAEVVPALEHGAIDLEPDYAGSLLLYLNKHDVKAATSLSATVPALRKLLAADGATVLQPAKVIDTNVFAITKATDRKDHLGPHPTLSQLKPYAAQMVLGGPPECPQYATCLPGLERVYGLHFKSFQSTDESGPVTVTALKTNRVQVAELFSTDAWIVREGFIRLQDNKHLQAADNLIPVIRKSVDTPKVAAALNKLAAKLTTKALTALNVKVGFDHESEAVVAHDWLVSQGLI